MFQTLGNITANPRVGLLFLDFARGGTLQLTGSATIDWDAWRAAAFPGARRLIEVRIARAIAIAGALPLRWRFVRRFLVQSRLMPRQYNEGGALRCEMRARLSRAWRPLRATAGPARWGAGGARAGRRRRAHAYETIRGPLLGTLHHIGEIEALQGAAGAPTGAAAPGLTAGKGRPYALFGHSPPEFLALQPIRPPGAPPRLCARCARPRRSPRGVPGRAARRRPGGSGVAGAGGQEGAEEVHPASPP